MSAKYVHGIHHGAEDLKGDYVDSIHGTRDICQQVKEQYNKGIQIRLVEMKFN